MPEATLAHIQRKRWKKTREIEDFIDKKKLDVLVITESWREGLQGLIKITNNMYKRRPQVFNIYHIHRAKYRGGGAAVIIHRLATAYIQEYEGCCYVISLYE